MWEPGVRGAGGQGQGQGLGSGPKWALDYDARAGAKWPHSLLEVLGTPDVGVPQVHVLLHLVVAVLYHACMRLPRLKLLERAAAVRSTPRILEVLVLLPAQVTPPPTPQSRAGLAPRPPGGSRALLGWGPWLSRNKAALPPAALSTRPSHSGVRTEPCLPGHLHPERGQGGASPSPARLCSAGQ